MQMKHVLSAAFGVIALGLVATTAQAAPLAGPGSVAQAGQAGLVEKTTFYGHYHYGYYPRHRYYKPYGYYYKPHHYDYYKPHYYGYYKPYYHRHYRHRHYRHHHHW